MDTLNKVEIPSNLRDDKNDVGIHIYGCKEEEWLRYNTIDESIFQKDKIFIVIEAVKDKISNITIKTYFLVTNPNIDEALIDKSKAIIKKLIELDEKKPDMISILISVNPNLRPDRFNQLLKRKNSTRKTEKLSSSLEDQSTIAQKTVESNSLKPKSKKEYIDGLSNQNPSNDKNYLTLSPISVKKIKGKNGLVINIDGANLDYNKEIFIKICSGEEKKPHEVVISDRNTNKDVSKSQNIKKEPKNNIKHEDISSESIESNINNVKSKAQIIEQLLASDSDIENSHPLNKSNPIIKKKKDASKTYLVTDQGTAKEKTNKAVKKGKRNESKVHSDTDRETDKEKNKKKSYNLYAEKNINTPKKPDKIFRYETDIKKDPTLIKEIRNIKKRETLISKDSPKKDLNEIKSVPDQTK